MKSKPSAMVFHITFAFSLLFIEATMAWPSGLGSHQAPLMMAPDGVAESEKTGCYIVVLKEDTSFERFQSIILEVVPMSEDAKLHGSVQRIAKAFTVKLSQYALNIVRSLPEVDYVEEETMVHGTLIRLPKLPNLKDLVKSLPQPPLWYLDRIDQHDLPLDKVYRPDGTGEGIDIYILDTGVNYDHEEFENRAEYAGYDPVDVNAGENREGRDCHGHGTHVASLAAGKTYGTAKNARIYSVRVLKCGGTAALSTIIDGLDYVSQVIPERGRPAVVSMSLAGPISPALNDAVKSLHDQGITVVAAAGNDRDDACSKSPAGSPAAITVGGSATGDGIYDRTNAGSCVDIFAPGANILAADYSCNTCTTYKSGTSMATPLVSGIVAICLENGPNLTPDRIKSLLISASTKNALDFSQLPSAYRSSTPNHLLYFRQA